VRPRPLSRCSEDQIRKFIAEGKLPRVPLCKARVRTTWAAIKALAEAGEAVA
jgi:hypothetical protein